jgi:hypothetical protein
MPISCVQVQRAVCLNAGSRTNAIIVERAEGGRGDNRARQGPPAVRFQELGTTQRYMHLSPAALDAAIRLLETGTESRHAAVEK